MDVTTAQPMDRSIDGLKALLLTVLFIATFLMAVLPFIFRKMALHTPSEVHRRRHALVFTMLSCFGGGVFLATCLLDLLPDALADVARGYRALHLRADGGDLGSAVPLAEFLVAIGFFLVLFTEQIVQWCRERDRSGGGGGLDRLIAHAHSEENGEDFEPETAPAAVASAATVTNSSLLPRLTADSDDDTALVESTDTHFNPRSHSTMRAILLVLALSLHSAFDGLALGVSGTSEVALQLFSALAIHKSVVGFSLGLRLVQSRLTNLAILLCVCIFSTMSLIGGVSGMIVTDTVSKQSSALVSGCLESIACGTFLYVTCFEILPHELNTPGHRLTKLMTLLAGFACITLFISVYPES